MFAVDDELNLASPPARLAASPARQGGSTPSWVVVLLIVVAIGGGAYACSSRKSQGAAVVQTQAPAPPQSFPKGWSYIYNSRPWKMADGRVVQPNTIMLISWHVDRGYRYLVGQDGSWQGWVYYPAEVRHNAVGLRGLEAAAAVCSRIRFRVAPPPPPPNACSRPSGTDQPETGISQAIQEVERMRNLVDGLAASTKQ